MTIDDAKVGQLFDLMNHWNGDLVAAEATAILEMVHPDYELYDNGVLTASGRAQFAERIRLLKQEDPDFRQEAVAHVKDGNVVVVRWKAFSTGQNTFDGITWAEFSNDQLHRVYQWWDQPKFKELLDT